MGKVSVIIPTYNEEKVIGECLNSLVRQTYINLEIIVVDDGSTDSTISKIKNEKLKMQIKNLKLLKQGHKGPGEARNLGAKHATGDILVLVDADMTFDPDFVKNLVMPIVGGKLKGTFSKEEYVSNWENVWARCWNINEGWEDKKRHPKNYPDKQKVFRAILKNEFDRVGGFSKGGFYTDDWTLSEKLGYEAVVAPGTKFYHKNPETLGEVFQQTKWVAKRAYKLGLFGILVGLLRASLPISLVVGAIKALTHGQHQFLIFKIVYDLGIFVGIIKFLFSGRGVK